MTMVEYNIPELIQISMENNSAERPTEYSFVWSCIAPLILIPEKCRNKIKILDVGGGESKLSKTLSELKFDVTVIDIADVDHGSARYIRANILDYEFPENTFDMIIAISTVEHIGLSCYGQAKQDEKGDIKTMEKIYRWLKPYGLAIITLPYGKPHHPPTFERVYNRETLKERILSGRWNVLRIEYACDDREWRQCLEHETVNRDAVVMLLLQKR